MFDIIPYPNEIEVLFILESPYQDEMDHGYALAGKSGRNMSRVILGDDSIPFGKLLFDKDKRVTKYGVFNSCHFPLEIADQLINEQLLFSKIKEVPQNNVRVFNYKQLDGFLKGFDNLDDLLNYNKRLKSITAICRKLNTLVVCGFIAQSIFLKLYPSIQIPNYNSITPVINKKTGIRKNILFVNHPSEKESKWVYRP